MRWFGLLALTVLLAQGQAFAAGDETLGMQPPSGAFILFDGTDLADWVGRDGKSPPAWEVKDGVFAVKPGAGSIRTREQFGSCRLHIEFNVPYMPQARGQGRGNSGVYVAGRHEVQVLDSYGLDSKDNDCGGIYKQYAPAVNACKPPLQWQTFDIDYRAPVVQDGKVKAKARITVRHNGQVIIEDKEIVATPGGVDGDNSATMGPLLLQDHGNDVQFRNIWILPLDHQQVRRADLGPPDSPADQTWVTS
jgi:hypothetical protein